MRVLSDAEWDACKRLLDALEQECGPDEPISWVQAADLANALRKAALGLDLEEKEG